MSNGTQSQQAHAAAAPPSGLVEEIVELTAERIKLAKEAGGIALRSRYMAEAITTDDQATTIIMIGAELGIPPMTALREIHLIPGKDGRFKPAISAHLKHALAMRKVPGFVLEVLQADERAAIVTAIRPGMKAPARFEWTRAHSERAGLFAPTRNGAPSNHTKYPVQMFLARVKSIAVDTIAPEATIGFPTVEELRDEEHLERIAQMGTLPAVGAASGKDPADIASPAPDARGFKSCEELLAGVADAVSLQELEAFRDRTTPDRLHLPKEHRALVVEAWTKRYAELGGKLGRAAQAKTAAGEQAQGTPAPTDASPSAPSGDVEKGEAKPARAPRRTPEEAKSDDAKREAELVGEIADLHTREECISWGESESVKTRRKKLTPGARGRVDDALTAREAALEEQEAAEGAAKDDDAGGRQPGDD